MLTAKVVVPLPAFDQIHRSIIERSEKYPVTLLCAPPGYVHTESLAAGIFERQWPVTWCRLAVEDGDPGVLLLSLIQSLQQLAPEVGRGTIKRMRQQPGPVYGWPQLFAALASEAAGLLPLPCWVVLEDVQFLQNQCSTLELLVTHFLSLLPDGVHTILVTSSTVHCTTILSRTPTISENELRLDPFTGQNVSAEWISEFSTNDVLRLVHLVKGQAAVLTGVLSASPLLGSARVMQIIRSSNSTEDLLTQIARACLLKQNSSAIESLAVSQHLEYSHPRIVQAVLLGVEPPEGPWWQPLEDGWKFLRPLWRRPLKTAMRSAAPGHAALARAAQFYLQHKMPEKSVPLYMEIGELSKAAEVMDHVADRMMDMGQWELLRSWINMLPAPVLQQWPWLVYAASEMVASQGDLNAARRAFGKTISLFKDRQDLPGICQSLLAECALAVQDSDWDGAVASAQEALHWAETGSLYWYIIWANWALGYLYLKADQYDSARPCFVSANEAAVLLANVEVIHLTDMMTRLLLTKGTLTQEIEQHRLEYLELESKEKAVVNQIQYLMQDTHGYVTELLETCGWSNIPLTLKLSAETVHPQPVLPPPAQFTGIKEIIHGFLNFFLRPVQTLPVQVEVPIPLALKPDAPVKEIPALEPATQHQACYSITPLTITVYLLGSFRIVVQDHVLQNWPKGRGRSLFNYLLTHRERPTPREVLMDVFWPDIPPDTARNRLNVAMHGIRKILSDAGEHLILFQDGMYQINPENVYWVDMDEFTCQYQEGYGFDQEHHVESAVAAYESCLSLYHGDYLEDEPYEEWPVLTREKLRILYLSVLDRLSEIYLNQGQYTRCIDLSQRILDRDNCREDAYCRLMRCYASQDQVPLALRQYQICQETLFRELEVEPSPATRQLYQRILRREALGQNLNT